MMTFIALTLQMGRDLKDTLHDYWSRLRPLHTPFYGETMTRDRFLHILRFLHFADSSQRPDQGEELQVDHETVFPPSGSNSTQQLDSVIFMWGLIYPPRFQTSSGEEFD